MRNVIVFLITMFLVGCGSNPVKPEPKIIKETRYVLSVPTDKTLFQLPTPVQNIDVDTASQVEVAGWLIDKELYIKQLENKIIGISTFYAKKQKELDEQAAKDNLENFKNKE